MQVFDFRVFLFVALCTYALGCSERRFEFVNNCNYKVWPAMWYAHAGTATNNGNGWELAAGANMTYCAPNNWSGRIWPRTGCSFNSAGECANNQACCASGNCVNSNNRWGLKCAQPSGPGPTLAEFTLINHANPPYADFYDVSMVDGANIPVEIQPIRGTFTPSGNPYTCGSPGCTARTCPNSFALNRCSWTFNTGIYASALLQTHPAYCTSNSQCKKANCNWQTSTCSCNTDSDCNSGQQCGSTFIPGIGLTRTCGTASGYFTADSMCLLSNYGSPLNCSATVPGQGTNTNLYACNGPNALSCLTNGARPTCCGCPSWMPAGDCKNTNPAWNRIAEPPAKIFKNACPTAYSYPYDDSTSTFTCGSTVGVSYTITFCPAGSPGAR